MARRRPDESETQESIPMKTMTQRRAALLELLELQAKTRPMFARMDALKTAIVDCYPAGTPIVLDRSGATVVMIEDQFADKHSCWKSTKFERYQIKQV